VPSQAVLRSRCVNLESPAVRRLALKQNLRQNLSGRKFDILKPRWLPTADALLADKAYDADERVIEPLREAEIEPVIPAKANRKQPRPYDKDLYKARSLIENFFCKLKQFRAIATRYDKTARNFLAAIHLAAAVVWLN